MKSRIFSLILALTIVFANASTALASVTGSYEEASNEVTITGQLSADKAGSSVTMMLLALEGDKVKDIEYVKKATVDSDGGYEFNFRVFDKSNAELERYTLKVNEAGEDVTNTVLEIIADPDKVDITNPDNILPVADAKIKEDNSRVYIKGNIGTEYYGESVSLMLINPKGNEATKIGYVDITTVDYNGDYEFKFKFNSPTGKIDDYYVRINKAGEEVSNTLIEAVAENDVLFDYEAYITENNEVGAKFNVELINHYGLTPAELFKEGFTQILAFYEEDSGLIKTVLKDISSQTSDYIVNEENVLLTVNETVPENAAKVKGFVWKSCETLLPILPAEENVANEKIVCWGDSLTQGAGGAGTRYPGVLATLTNKEVSNYGIGSESATSIAVRQGGIKLALAQEIVIPAEQEAVEITFNTSNGVDISGNLLGNEGSSGANKGLNPVTINGIEGKITRVGSIGDEDIKYYFTRTEAGESVAAAANTQIVPGSMTDGIRDDINVIFVGQNGGYSDGVNGLISVIDAMIANMTSDRYVIVGLTTSQRKAYEPIMQSYYGANYINMREWLVSDEAIAMAGLTNTLTDDDKLSLKNGDVPSCLRADDVHLNASGYTLVGNKIYERMQELNYVE